MRPRQVGDAWKFLKDEHGMQLMVYNNLPITVTPPNHVVLKVEYCEPGARGNTATNVHQAGASWKPGPKSWPRRSSTRAITCGSTPAPANTSNGPRIRTAERISYP